MEPILDMERLADLHSTGSGLFSLGGEDLVGGSVVVDCDY